MACNMWEEMGLLYGSGELNDQERTTFNEHVAQCGECRQELEAYQSMRQRFFSEEILGDAPSAACDAEIIRVCSDGRKKVASLHIFPGFIRKSIVSVALFILGFTVVSIISFKAGNGSIQKSAGITQKATQPSAVAAAADKQKDSTADSSRNNPTNYANTRGTLDVNGVYPVDLQNK
jgi:anti-sigma factor RsiW